MPEIAPIQVSGILRRYMSSERLSQGDIAELVGLSRLTINKFVNGQTNPHRETLDKIQDFLKNEGAMTRFGFPTDVPPPTSSILPAVPAPEDTSILKELGITTEKKPKHYLCGYIEDWDFALLIQSIMNSPADEQAKKRLLGTLCQQDFPSLSV